LNSSLRKRTWNFGKRTLRQSWKAN
jgi:hypothetical protein